MDEPDERLGTTEGASQKRGPGRPPKFSNVVHDERAQFERERQERDVTEDRELTEDDRLDMFLDSHHQSILPDLPVMPGYHVCWLTTSNPRDSIQWRVRIGYTLISIAELPGWEGVAVKSGDYQGIVGVNEMVAARIPISLYNKLMRAVHHILPLQEEEKLRANTDRLREQARASGAVLDEGEGMRDIVQRAKPMPEMAH